MSRAGAGLVAGAFLALGLALAVHPVGAQDGDVTGPTITLDKHSVRPGERVFAQLTGFEGDAITLSVCGNQARRGSVDCNMPASEAVRVNRRGPVTLAEFPVTAPVSTCPCLIRASSTTLDQLAIAPIELIGHPVGPIVGTSKLPPLEVTVSARRAPRGFVEQLRSAIGGPTGYDVTIRVRNRSTERLERIVLAGAAGRKADDVGSLDVPSPGALEPGQTWTKAVRTELPAPAIGSFAFEVTASGAGPSASARDSVRVLPPLLVVLMVVLLADVGYLVHRRLARAREERHVEEGGDEALVTAPHPETVA